MRSRIGAIMVVAISLTLALAASVQADQPLGKVQFRDRFIAAIHKTSPQVKVKVVSDDQIELSEPGRDEVRSNLFNAYRAYLLDPSKLNTVIAGYTKLAVEAMRPADSIKIDDIVILIRPRGYLAESPQEKGCPAARGRSGAGDCCKHARQL